MLSELKTSKQKEQNSEGEDFHSATKQEVQKRWNARLRTKRSTENTKTKRENMICCDINNRPLTKCVEE